MLWTALAANCCYTVLMFPHYSKLLVFIFLTVNFVTTIGHVFGGYVIFFQLCFAFGVFYMNFSMIFTQWQFGNSMSKKILILEFVLFITAAILWFIDMQF